MTPSLTARQPCARMPRSDWSTPRFGAPPRRVRSSAASTTDRSASIIGTGRRDRPRSAGLAGGGLLHEPQSILDLFFLLVHVEQPQVLLDRGAHPLLEGVALDAKVLDHALDLTGLARGLIEELTALDLRLFDHELGFLARLLLDVLRQLLRGHQRVLEDALALFVVRDPGLDLGQLLLERVVVDDQLL